jgi:hypothetical protein
VSKYQLAEINIARMKGMKINDLVMKEFVDNLAGRLNFRCSSLSAVVSA